MAESTGYDFGHLAPAEAGLGRVFARPRMVAAGCVLLITGLGWLYLAVLSAAPGGAGSWIGMIQVLCRAVPDGPLSLSGGAIIVSMWSAMALAMMLPSAAPMILTYAEIAETAARKGEPIVSPLVIAAGYASVWFMFAVAASAMQMFFTRAAWLDTSMASTAGFFAAAIFTGAGLYQFSTLKHACLARCQHPFPFFFANWATTPGGVFRLGVRQGLFCLGCCWAMMLLMFAVGVMNVVWMAGLSVVMTVEKLQTGRRFTQVVGLALIAIGMGIAVAEFAAYWPG